MSLGEEAVRLMRSVAGSWQYTNDERRLDPDTYGATDCSGSLRWAFLKLGVDIGYWTGDQSHSGVEVARGHYPWEIPWDAMRPGDRILMTATYWNNYNFDKYLCHTELYCGGGTMIGLPGGWGPTEKWAQAWMEVYKCITWMVRRDFEGDDEVEASEILGYKNPNMTLRPNSENIDSFQMWWNASQQLTRTDNAGWKTPSGHDIYGRVNAIQEDVADLKKSVANLKVAGATIDYDKLAKALAPVVADELSARLKA